MAIAPIAFSTDPGKILDFSGHSPASIFNNAILPRVNSFMDLLPQDPGGLEEAAQRREAQLAQDLDVESAFRQEDEDFFASLRTQRRAMPAEGAEMDVDYDSPMGRVSEAPAPLVKDPTSGGFTKENLKLANYGYASDSTPDYNSNVLKIGHANNKLVDGYSAALTKSLATRYGLKTGDEFEVVTADGKIMRRRYDDTVPSKYKGKSLPETVDLYEVGGSNKFGGKVVGLRPLRKAKGDDPRELKLPDGDGDIDKQDTILPPRY